MHLDAPGSYSWNPELSIALDLPHKEPYRGLCWESADGEPVRNPKTGRIIEKNDIRAGKSALGTYGSGQQDMRGLPVKYLFS